MVDALVANFQQYSISELITLAHTPTFFLTILSLIILEATLSCDNAIVLAIVVKHLPEAQRNKALKIGIACAYLFRFIAIGLGTFLVKFWYVKLIGGAYLLYLAIKHFKELFGKGDEDEMDESKFAKGFLGTVVTVEMMDIAFSMDSTLAAFGVSDHPWILFIGGMMGILAMRFAAGLFIKLLEKVPELEHGAYVLIFVIGAKMLASIWGLELADWGFYAIMTATFGGSYLYNKMKK